MHLLKKRSIKIVSVVVAVFLVLATAIFAGCFRVNAAEINEVNPELTAININGDAESVEGVTAYVPENRFEQNTQEGTYALPSNSFNAWTASDDVSFAYREYNVAPIASDSLKMEITLNSFVSDTPGKTLHRNASTGLMVRSGLTNTSSAVFFHAREQGLLIVYRTNDGELYSRSVFKSFTYPVQLQITVSGTSVECRYKDAAHPNWSLMGYAAFNYSGPIYAGLHTQSLDPNTFARGNFSNLKVSGYGSYDPSGSGGNTSEGTDSKPEEKVDEDLDLSDNVNIVLHETFSKDGELAIGKDAGSGEDVTYAWTSHQKRYDYDNNGAITEDKPKYHDLVAANGNRYLYKSLTQNTTDYIGDTTWSDYKVSMDVQFTEKCETNYESAANMVKLMARSRIVEWYGLSGYAAVLQNEKQGTTLSLYKMVNDSITDVSDTGTRVAGPIVVDNFLGDGKWHNLAVSVFDNLICVYYDYEKQIEFIDPGDTENDLVSGAGRWEEIVTFGNVGVSTYQTDCYIDNVIVELQPDTVNGNYDNYVGGGWNEPIPSIISDWTNDKKYAYYFNGINGSNAVVSKKE